MPEVFYTKSSVGLTLLIDGTPAVVDKTNPNYDLIEDDLKNKRYDRIMSLASVKSAVTTALDKTNERRLFIKDGQIMFNGPKGPEVLNGALVKRIVETIRAGSTVQAIAPLIKLLSNISRNKQKDIRQELYEFLMSGRMPITMDGCFLAYKKVRSNYYDIHSGKFDNSPGKLVAMPESEVDTNRNNECSRGLHFCSRGYLPNFGGGHHGNRVVVVKVNPRHVFAIPRDYNCAKGRASEYYVVGEVTGDPHKDEMFLQPFIFDDNVKEAAPQVKFIKPDVEPPVHAEEQKPTPKVAAQETVTINNLKPSIKTMAEGYGLSADGKAWVRVSDSKGPLSSDKYSIVKPSELPPIECSTFVSAITGKPVEKEHVKCLSIQTKSVRSALARAVARRRNNG